MVLTANKRYYFVLRLPFSLDGSRVREGLGDEGDQ
jgi:hypothetical protein